MDQLMWSFRVLAILGLALSLLVDSGSPNPIPEVVLQGARDVNGIVGSIDNARPSAPTEMAVSSKVTLMASLSSSLVDKAKLSVWKLSENIQDTVPSTHKPPWFSRSLGKDSWRAKFGCLSCRMIVKAAHLFIRAGASEDEVSHFGTAICTRFKIATYRECHGLAELMKKQLVYVFMKTSIDPAGTCSSILEEDCGAPTGPDWTIELPDVPKPKVDPVPDPEPSAQQLRVLQVTDVHLDVDYLAGANANCGEMLCCREKESNASQHPAGTFGTLQGCDTPVSTVESLLAHASRTQKIDYVLWTGDDSPHDDWNQTTDSQLRVLQKMTELLAKYFPNTPIFASVGNHEGNPVNSFPPPYVEPVASMDWLYGPLNRTWSRWMLASSRQTTSETILRGGFYSTSVFPGLRIISLNMNYCNNLNWWLMLNATDPLGQLQWLSNELQAAELRHEKVHIIGHIPPGCGDCLPAWSANYHRIINRYESTVRGQFFGHTHNDEFEVFYDVPENVSASSPRPTNVAYISPSVTPYNGENPAYRIYTIDGNHSDSTWAVLDHETYYLNLQEANLSNRLKWLLLYSAKDAYHMHSLQPVDWNEFVDNLEKDDSLFGLYYSHYHRGSDVFPKCETAECRSAKICHIRSAQSGNYNLCHKMSKPTLQ